MIRLILSVFTVIVDLLQYFTKSLLTFILFENKMNIEYRLKNGKIKQLDFPLTTMLWENY